jgi:hypothetical protein
MTQDVDKSRIADATTGPEEHEEIEITEEMVKAGGEAFLRWHGLLCGEPEDAAHAIFMAMVSASPKLRNFRLTGLE